jgi:hypothetical protein
VFGFMKGNLLVRSGAKEELRREERGKDGTFSPRLWTQKPEA